MTVNDAAAARPCPGSSRRATSLDRRHPLRPHAGPGQALEAGIAKLRINPGNIGSPRQGARGGRRPRRGRACPSASASTTAACTGRYEKPGRPTRPGPWCRARWTRSRILAEVGFHDVAVSLKSSDRARRWQACRRFAASATCPQHLGVTEAGTLLAGTVPLRRGDVGAARRGDRRHRAHQPGRRPRARGDGGVPHAASPSACARGTPAWSPARPAGGSRWTWWASPSGWRK